VLVFLARHAHADPGEPDELRKLSVRGRDEAQALASRLAVHTDPPRLVLTSPLLRAQETAEVIAKAAAAELRVDDRLRPGTTSEGLQAAVAGSSGPVVAVCHQPDCSQIAVALTGEDPGFPTGSVVELTLAP
jgi:phosphohistidine phosphatase